VTQVRPAKPSALTFWLRRTAAIEAEIPVMVQFSTESNRLEAFSDGVLAVIITIMVLDLRAPHTPSVGELAASVPTFLAYVLSFVFIGIYWNNHHHMLRASEGIDGAAMWANLHLLFWLSLVPFTTLWLGENPTSGLPSATYGFVLLMCAIAYTLLQRTLYRVNGPQTPFAQAVNTNFKEKLSLGLYVCAVVVAFFLPFVADALYVLVAVMWLIPDRRFEPIITLHR
jgi:uncharacterized membrane protein